MKKKLLIAILLGGLLATVCHAEEWKEIYASPPPTPTPEPLTFEQLYQKSVRQAIGWRIESAIKENALDNPEMSKGKFRVIFDDKPGVDKILVSPAGGSSEFLEKMVMQAIMSAVIPRPRLTVLPPKTADIDISFDQGVRIRITLDADQEEPKSQP